MLNPEPLNPLVYLKYLFLYLVGVTTFFFIGNYSSARAWAGQIPGDASYEVKGRSAALAFLHMVKKKPFEKIKAVTLEYDLYMECEWMIDIKMNMTLKMKKEKKGFVATYSLSEPVGENLWGKLALFFFGRFTESYKKLVKAIKGKAIETFHLKKGKFQTDELIEIRPRKKEGKKRKGFRILFDYDKKVINFWKNSSQKKPTASVKYENQVGPLTAYFNFIFFEQPETDICLINQQRRAKQGATPGKGNFREWKGDFLFAPQIIKLRPNCTGKHLKYAHVVFLGKDGLFDIVYGKYVYYNLLSIASSKVKAPYSCYVGGIIDKGKKRKKAERLKTLKKKAKDRKSFEKQLKAIEAMNILAAWNVKVHMTNAEVGY